jgi:O-antigen/teichoic acid export membrane protein
VNRPLSRRLIRVNTLFAYLFHYKSNEQGWSQDEQGENVSNSANIPENPLHEGFGDRVRSAVIWRSGSQILAQIITWGSTLAVIRLLDPSDYGLFAMTQVVIAFLSFLNGYGFASALVQSESLDPLRVRQAFGLLLLLNGLLATLQYFGAPYAAAYYGQPIVADLLRLQALMFLATPFIALPEVMMARSLEFRKQAVVNMVAALVGAGTALGCALAGYGVWTLVYAPIALFWTRAIGLTLAARLLVWPSFDFRGCGQIVGFGSAVLASSFFWLIQSQSDIFIAGGRFDPHALGLYAEALFLTQIFVSKFVPPINEVAFPAYAQIQKDGAAVRWSFLKAVRLLMLVAAPAYCGVAVTAGPLVETLFGPKWVGMVPYVQILSLAMIFTSLQILFSPVTNALGKPGISARAAFCGAILFPAAFLIGSRFGLIGLAWGWLISMPILLVITARLSSPIIGVSLGEIGRAALPGLAPALVMAVAVGLLGQWLGGSGLSAPIRLILLISAGVVIYPALLWALERDAIDEVKRLIFRTAPPPTHAPVQDAI